MSLKNTTPIPNEFFEYIPTLSHAEIRVLLVVIRQTHGWKDFKTGQRKIKDKLSYSFLIKKTGLYRTILTETIKTLVDKRLLLITDFKGNILKDADERKGKRCLFYQFQLVRNFDTTYSQTRIELVRNSEHNKRNTIKKEHYQKNISNIDDLVKSLVETNRKKMDSL